MSIDQQQVPIYEQTTLAGALVDVLVLPDGTVMETITIPATGRQFVVPMSAEAAKEIGAKLSAPHVVRAGGVPMNGNGRL